MAALTNSVLSFGQLSNREDVINVITNISPTDTPFQKMVDTGTASNTLHEWLNDVLAAAAANAVVEGDDTLSSYTFTAQSAPARLSNRCQISRKDGVVSGTQDVIKKYGRTSDKVYYMTKLTKELRRDMELVLTNNQAPVVGNSTTARQMRPLEGWITTNAAGGAGYANGTTTAAATDGTQRAFTQAMLATAMQGAFNNGGDPSVLMVGTSQRPVVSQFASYVTRQSYEPKTLSMSVSVIETDFGDLKVVTNRFQRARTAFVLTPSLWCVDYLRPVQPVALDRTGDNEKFMILGEYTLVSKQEAGSAKVADLS